MKKNAIDIAKQWLQKQYEDIYGKPRDWPQATWDRFHAELGFLVNFVTDCWPDS